MEDKKVPQRLYLHKHYIQDNGGVINCHSIYTEKQSEDDIEYVININKQNNGKRMP